MASSLTRRVMFSLIGASMVLTGFTAMAAAAPTELIFNVFIPKRAPLFKKGLEPWAKQVEEASGGTLKITIPTASLASAPKQYDIVQDGVADMAIAPIAFRRKQLSLYTIGAIPLIADNAKNGSVAYWQTHEKFFAGKDQFKDLVPLTLFMLGAPAILSNTDPILSQADLSGYKVLAVGKEKITTWKNLTATPVGGSGQKPFEVVSSGVANGATNPLGTAVVQGMLQATKHVTLVPGGMGGRAVFVLFISRDRLEGLPEQAQKALVETSGSALAAKLGGIMDGHDKFGLKKFSDKGITIHQASDAFVKEINEAGAFITGAWKKNAAKLGVDAEAALAHFKSVAGN